MKRILITDLDNTLYNWMDFFGPSFRGMIHALSREMNMEEDLIYDQFKEVFSRTKSVEYSYSIQELAACRELDLVEIERLVRLGRGAFRRIRQKRLVPYEGVAETLLWANRNSIYVIGISNAPLFHVKRRLSNLRLDKYFSGIGAWEGNLVPEVSFIPEIDTRLQNNSYKSKISRFWSFGYNELKPSSEGFRRVIRDLGVSPEDVFVIGDSIAKDVEPAMELGAVGIWARYGMDFQPENYETVLKISPWSTARQFHTYNHRTKDPTYTVDSFADLRTIIEPEQGALFT